MTNFRFKQDPCFYALQFYSKCSIFPLKVSQCSFLCFYPWIGWWNWDGGENRQKLFFCLLTTTFLAKTQTTSNVLIKVIVNLMFIFNQLILSTCEHIAWNPRRLHCLLCRKNIKRIKVQGKRKTLDAMFCSYS